MIDEDGNEIPHRAGDRGTGDNGVQQTPFLLRRDRGILPHPPQLHAPLRRIGDGAQFPNDLAGVELHVEHDIGKSTGVAAGNGRHQCPSFPEPLLWSPSSSEKFRTSAWSVALSTRMRRRAKSTERSAANTFRSRRAAFAAAAISCSAEVTILRVSSSAADLMRASSADASFSAAAYIAPISVSRRDSRASISDRRRFASSLAWRASCMAF